MNSIDDYTLKSSDNAKIEGALSNEYTSKMLIVLKEPHSDDDQIFWFYNVVNNLNDKSGKNARRGTGKRFFNILGSMACSILKDETDKEIALKNCAYINLYPYDGKAVSEYNKSGYSLTYNAINAKRNEKNLTKNQNEKISEWNNQKGCDINRIAEKRIALFDHLKECGIKYILTVPEIFNLLCNGNTTERFLTVEYGKNKNIQDFDQCTLSNGVTVFEFWHPSCTRISYDHLNEALECRKCNQ